MGGAIVFTVIVTLLEWILNKQPIQCIPPPDLNTLGVPIERSRRRVPLFYRHTLYSPTAPRDGESLEWTEVIVN